MSSFDFFMSPVLFFNVIEEVIKKYDVKIIFRRPKTNDYPSGWRVISIEENLADIYTSEGYCQIYFSLGMVPIHFSDWGFIDRAETELIEIRGGRMDGRELELSTLRVISKTSKANQLFKDLKKKIVSISDKGRMMICSTLYPNIYYTHDIEQYELYENLDSKAHVCKLINRDRLD